MRPETESLEGLGNSLAKAMRCDARVAFVFYCLTAKMGTLDERLLLAERGHSYRANTDQLMYAQRVRNTVAAPCLRACLMI
jgi:hypothetical protein